MRIGSGGMTAGRGAVALAALLALSACGDGDGVPDLMNIRSSTDGPDEFAILPARPLQSPESFTELPEPTPGGTNLTDPDPAADAVAALGGNIGGGARGDAGLLNHTRRYGVTENIRGVLAAEDLEYRRDNNGRLLERLLNVNTYYRAYEDQSLDQQAELRKWRRLGIRTVSAPPAQDGE
jgi:hypothetical protein